MDLNFTEASALAVIDRQVGAIAENFTPAQYEIIRQVIYASADLEYQSLLRFSQGALAKGATALTAVLPIIIDVPEIQVSIVPKLQQTFANPVYCCATTGSEEVKDGGTKASNGLNILGAKYPHGIYIIGQDPVAMSMMMDLIEQKMIEPSLVIATPPTLVNSENKQRLKSFSTPNVHIIGAKGGANIATAIFNSLLQLAWQVDQQNQQSLSETVL
ncbi:MAG: precorrin-8X methylmutase [Cyanobacteria bacterium J06600_6]